MLTFEQIKELIELVAQNRLQGIELERSGFRLKIDGQPAQSAAASLSAASGSGERQRSGRRRRRPSPRAGGAIRRPPSRAPAAPAAPAGPPAGSHILTSPIVGTFYRSSSPDAAAVRRDRRRG